MIIVTGWVRLQPAAAERVRSATLEMARQTRQEAGCIEYSYAQDLGDPGLIHVLEQWESAEALNRHFATPHMAAFNAALSAAKILEARVKAYRAEFLRTLV